LKLLIGDLKAQKWNADERGSNGLTQIRDKQEVTEETENAETMGFSRLLPPLLCYLRSLLFKMNSSDPRPSAKSAFIRVLCLLPACEQIVSQSVIDRRAAHQRFGQANGHLQGVGSVVVSAQREVSQLIDQELAGGIP
jgi:hypothetical protein